MITREPFSEVTWFRLNVGDYPLPRSVRIAKRHGRVVDNSIFHVVSLVSSIVGTTTNTTNAERDFEFVEPPNRCRRIGSRRHRLLCSQSEAETVLTHLVWAYRLFVHIQQA